MIRLLIVAPACGLLLLMALGVFFDEYDFGADVVSEWEAFVTKYFAVMAVVYVVLALTILVLGV